MNRIAPEPAGHSPARLALRSREFVRGFRSAIAGIVSLALSLAVLGAVDPLVMKRLFDALGQRDPQHTIFTSLAALLVIELSRGLIGRWLSLLTWKVRLGVDLRMRDRLVAKLTALPVGYHGEQ